METERNIYIMQSMEYNEIYLSLSQNSQERKMYSFIYLFFSE